MFLYFSLSAMASEVVSHISVSAPSRCWHLINIGWWGLRGGKWTAKKVKNETSSSSQAFIDKMNKHIFSFSSSFKIVTWSVIKPG